MSLSPTSVGFLLGSFINPEDVPLKYCAFLNYMALKPLTNTTMCKETVSICDAFIEEEGLTFRFFCKIR
jgi:hypothetical protein